jgi:hypothetical protein
MLEPRVVMLLRQALKIDNGKQVLNPVFSNPVWIANGSRGCPASMKTVDVREDDFTDEQWVALTEGKNPVASYDSVEQELTMLRNPINEVTDSFAETLEEIHKVRTAAKE